MTHLTNPMTRRRALACLALLPAAWSAACDNRATNGLSQSDLRMLIPNTPGGGYDVTARTVARILENHEFTGPIEKFNVLGGGGSVALARLMRENGNDHLIAMVGLGVVGASAVNGAPWELSEATAVARVVEEPEALVVSADSPITSVSTLVEMWRRNPPDLAIGVGSAAGGPDHIFALQLARVVVPGSSTPALELFDGAGDLLTAILDGSVDVGIAGAGEYVDQIEAGSLRILAVSNSSAAARADVPTLTDSGIDIDFTNWRGFVAPPGISDMARTQLVDVFDRMRETPEWQRAVLQHGWTDSLITGDEFSEFLAAEDIRIRHELTDLGLIR